VSDIHNGDYIRVGNVDFGKKGPKSFVADVASALRGGTIEVRLDKEDGELIASLNVPGTGGWEDWKSIETSVVAKATGIHDVYFVFKGRKGPKLFNFDYWQFK
ncbi:MAG: carbohydrate-binding protein, partial [Duncaniella sp.]|nr:carbohydrate-binding protein [Duncaniella sp.]